MFMTSREIAELTGKEHKHVIRDIRALLDELGKDGSDLNHEIDGPKLDHPQENKDARGYTTCFYLNRELTETLLTGYSASARLKVVRRWYELEEQALPAQITIPQSLSEALRLAADLADMKAKADAALAIAAPKAEALDRLAPADGSFCIWDAAKTLQ
jgi:phage regulator Rha-like protein